MIRRFLIWWLASTVSLLLVAYVLPGFHVDGLVTAVKAAIVVGLVNGTLGVLLKLVTFPLTLVTLGLAWIVVNGLMLLLATRLVSGFTIDHLGWAMLGSIALSVVNWIVKKVLDPLLGKND